MSLCGKASAVPVHRGCDVLLLGLQGSGKTLLTKRMQALYCKAQDRPLLLGNDTVATIGTGFVEVMIRKVPGSSGRKHLTIREVGGQMCPLWPQYYSDCSLVIFTLDMSDATSLAGATTELYELLQAPGLAGKPLALALTKLDLPCTISRGELEMVTALSDLQVVCPGRISVIETSAVDGLGVETLLDWAAQTAIATVQV